VEESAECPQRGGDGIENGGLVGKDKEHEEGSWGKEKVTSGEGGKTPSQ